MQVSLIKPNPNNPRHIKKDKFDKLVNSIKQFPEMLEARPLILNKDNVVLGGNMRLQALIKAGINDVPVIHVDWDADKQSEFIIKDNLSYGEWDYDIIANEWDVIKLDDWGFDLPVNTELDAIDNVESDESIYTNKISTPIYEPSREKPTVDSLCNTTKFDALTNEIKSSDLNKEEKDFLLFAAARHIVFNYGLIADYYAHSTIEVQNLMEKSALVIIDYEKAIENGFVELSKQLNEILENEK